MDSESAFLSVDLGSIDTSAKALRVFFRIAKAWGLTSVEQRTLLGLGEAALESLEGGELPSRLDDATMARLSHIFAIYSALHTLLPIPERADIWIRRQNSAPPFGGSTALDRMMTGRIADLVLVRQYLDAQLHC